MKIRRATKEDIPEIAKLIKKEFAKPPYKQKWTKPSSEKYVSFFLKIGFGFLAIEDKNIVGVILAMEKPYDKGINIIIDELVVDSNYQGKGIGKKLVKTIEKEAKKRKAILIYFTTWKKAKAFNFYKKLNYHESKDSVIMGKKLK